MKAMITAAALAAATLGGMAAAPATANAQPGRYWHGPAHGPRWHSWRRGYYGRYHRYPVRVCRHGRCWYR